METREIAYRTLRWGPCVIQLKARKEFVAALLAEADKSTISYGDRLAGHLKKEVKLDSANYENYFTEMFTVYNHALSEWLGKKEKIPYIISDLWCNFQRANEFNPPHNHSGILSFDIYLKVPEAIKKECKAHEKTKKSAGPGSISFFMGDGDKKNSITNNSFFPQEGDMFIFPAWLKHWVYPYKSNVVRISVSGNVVNSFEIKYFSEEGIKHAIKDIEKKHKND